MTEAEEATKKKPRVGPKARLAIVGVGAALLGFIGGIAGSAAERESLQEQLDTANAEIEDSEAKREALIASAERLQAEFQRQQKNLEMNVAALDARKRNLNARAAKISAAEQTIKRNTIEDGIWQIGVDFDAGTYRSTASDCYWEILTSPDGSFSSLESNGLGSNQTVTLTDGWFSSEDCAPWKKVG